MVHFWTAVYTLAIIFLKTIWWITFLTGYCPNIYRKTISDA